jgi:hypothetical protein
MLRRNALFFSDGFWFLSLFPAFTNTTTKLKIPGLILSTVLNYQRFSKLQEYHIEQKKTLMTEQLLVAIF